MLIYKFNKNITVSSSTGSDNTHKFYGAELLQVLIEPATSTNIYDLALVDEDGDTIYEQLAIEGDFEEHAIYIPLKGIYTINISNATIDEDIAIKLMIDED